jgi:hypothetical protein
VDQIHTKRRQSSPEIQKRGPIRGHNGRSTSRKVQPEDRGHSLGEFSRKETYNSEGSSSRKTSSHSQRKGKKRKNSKSHDPEEFKKSKPPSFNGVIKKGEEVEPWLLGLKMYFRVHDYFENLKDRITIFNLNGKYSIWWVDLKNVSPTRTFFYQGPEESKYSSSPLGSSPTHSRLLLGGSPLRKFGKSRFGVRGSREHTFTCHTRPDLRWSTGQPSHYRDFPYRENRQLRCYKSPALQFAEPRIPIHCHVGSAMPPGPTCHVAFGGSRFASLRLQSSCRLKPRMPGSRCSRSMPPVHTRIDGLDQVGRSHFAISMCMKSLFSPTPIHRYATAKGLSLPES